MKSEGTVGESDAQVVSLDSSIAQTTGFLEQQNQKPIGLILLMFAASICILGGCLFGIRHLFPPGSAWSQGWFNPLDASIMTYVNRLPNRWPWIASVADILFTHNLLKDGPVVILLWIAFFPRTGSGKKILETRRKIAATVVLAMFGVVLARMLALTFPFRERPLRTVALHFQVPHIINSSVLYGWSSFPSDHEVLLVTLAAGLLLACRPLGVVALIYTFVVNTFLRVYAGLHWPTDLLAGAAIGVGLASIVNITAFRNFVWRVVTRFWRISPGAFAAFVFLLSYEIIDMFEGPLTLAKAVLKHHLR